MAGRPHSTHLGHRILRPASSNVTSMAYTNNKPLSGIVSIGMDRKYPSSGNNFSVARPATGRPKTVGYRQNVNSDRKSARSNKFTNEFLGRGFYRDTTMDGQRRHEIRKKLDEERQKKEGYVEGNVEATRNGEGGQPCKGGVENGAAQRAARNFKN